MNNQIIVSMKFQADTNQAKQKMKELQDSLTSLQAISNKDLPMNTLSSGLDQAKNAAAQLQAQLQSAFNVNTGKLDMSRFNQQMKQSNMSLEKYKTALMQAGPAGRQVFQQLAMQVATADQHVIRISARLAKLGATLANTLRWQISSAALMAVTSTLSEAYSFAQDLNKSLNNIRVVTGNSAEEMEKFAKEANKAAKALSTTTTQYTDASLIYFQQGLNEKQVKARTDLTIKMANVTGQSVEEVSNQLTSVWNNFDDGSKSLEHYIDVMVALGAATASSSEEISEGLNKFAAVAETVGLSYEYAAAALATVTATTRQSADVVGTAFKTLFARIQDLELGNTLEDGTTLGQYSEALAAVGINIKDSTGQIKDMNLILDEMGSKWNTLSKDAQIALAQNVAGVRQYTQLIALMDNWDYFQQNVDVAAKSEGTLTKQAEIYEESWQAASKRVSAAVESIYQSLLDDDVFIDILNFFADLFENIGNVTEALGGMKGVLLLISTILLNISKNSIAAGLSTMAATIGSFTAKGREAQALQREEAFTQATSMHSDKTTSGALRNQLFGGEIKLANEYNNLSEQANGLQKETLAYRKQGLDLLIQEAKESLDVLEVAEKQTLAYDTQIDKLNTLKNIKVTMKGGAEKNAGTVAKDILDSSRHLGASQIFTNELATDTDFNYKNLEGFNNQNYSDESLNKAGAAIDNVVQKMQGLEFGSEEAKEKLKDLFGDKVYSALEAYYNKLVQTQEKINELQSMSPENREAHKKDMANKEARLAELNKGGRITKHEKSLAAGGKGIKSVTEAERKEYRALTKEVEKYKNATTGLSKVSNKVTEAIDAEKQSLKDNQAALEGTKGIGEKTIDTVNKAADAYRKESEALVEANIKTKEANQGADKLNKTYKSMQGPVTASQQFTALASSMMSTAMALQSFKALWSTLSNEDMSFGDKMISLMMTLGMLIPSVTAALNAENLAKMVGLKLTKDANGKLIVENGLKTTNVVITWLQKIAQDALNGSLLATVGLFALIAVAVIAVVGIFMLLTKKRESDAEKARKAHAEELKQLEALTEAYNELKNTVDEVKEAISDYTTALDALKELEKGTDEYKEALEDVNKQAEELIKNHNLIRNIDWHYGSYGEIIINDDVLKDIEKKNEALLSNAQMSVLRQNRETEKDSLRVKEAETKEAINNNVKYLQGYNYGGTNYTSEASTVLTSKQLMILRDTVKTVTNDIDIANEDQIAAIKQAIAADDAFKNSTLILDSFINTETINAFKSLEEAALKTAEALGYLYEDTFAEIVDQKTDFESITTNDGSTISDSMVTQMNEIVGDALAVKNTASMEAFDVFAKEWEDKANSYDAMGSMDNVVNETSAEAAQFKETYEKITGTKLTEDITTQQFYQKMLEAQGYTNVAIKNGDDENTATYYNPNTGKYETAETLTNEQAQKAAWQYFASEAAKDYAAKQTGLDENKTKELEQDFQDIVTNSSDIMGADFSAALISGLSNYDAGNPDSKLAFDFTSAFNEISQTEFEKLKNSPDLIKALGFEGVNFENFGIDQSQLLSALEQAVASRDEEAYVKAQNAKGEKKAEELELDVDEFKSYREQLELLYPAYKKNVEGLNAVALANKRLMQGVEVLADDWDELNTIMSDGAATPEELSKILPVVEKGLKDILNLDDEKFELLPDDFAQKNWQLIQDVVNGVEGAVDKLRDAAGQNILLTITGAADFSQVDAAFQVWHNKLLAFDQEKFEIGVEIAKEDEFFKLCDEMVRTAGKTSAEMQAYFAAMGYDVELVTDKDGKATALKVITPSGSYGGGLGVTTAATSTDKKPKDKKVFEDEVDRYHEIKEELSDIERELNAISKAKDRAFGGDKVKLMEAELKKTEEMARVQQQYLDDIRAKAQTDQAAANAIGISTDASGRISNYEEALQAAIDRYNAVVTKQNASDDEIDKAEKEYEKFIKTLEQYEETLNLLEDEQEKLIDLQNQMKDQELEKITYEVEIKVKVSDNELKALERMLKKLDDPVNDAADAISLLSKTLAENLKKVDAYENGIKKIFDSVLSSEQIDQLLAGDFSVLDGISLTDAQISELEKYRDSLYDTEDAINEFYGSVIEQVNAAFEAHNEDAEKSITKIERLTSVLDTYQNVIDLVGQKALGMNADTLKALSKAKVDAAQTQLESLQTQLKANEDMLISSQTALEQAQTDEEKEYWQKQVETQQEKVEELKEAVNQSWVDTLQAAADDFALAVETTKTAFEEAMAGIYGTFEKMQEAYAQQQEAGDRYLDTYKQVYELSKLNRDLNKSIDSTDSIKGKQALRDLQEEINRLQESDAEMSQYDLDYLRKKYDLRVAEIALEEAQNAKSQVRMQRDAEGNWGYVYTADESKTADAAQNYEDKLYAIQELSSGYIDSMEEKIIQAEIDMAQKAAEVRREDYASEEEYQKAVNDVTKYYSELRSYYISEMQKALGNNKDIYNNDWLAYSEYSGKVLDADNGWRTQFSETFIAQRNGYTSIEQDRAAFESATTTMAGNLATAFSQWQSAASLAFQTVGHDFKTFGAEDGEMATAVNAIVGKLEGIGKEMDTWGEDAKSNFKKITDAAAGEFTAFSAEIDKYIGKSQAMIDAINEALKKQAEAEGQDYTPPENKENPGKSEATEPPQTAPPPTGPPSVEPPVEPKTAYFLSRGEDTLEYEVNGTRYGQLSNGFYAKMEDILDRGNQVSVNDYMPGETEYVINIDKIQTYTIDELGIDDETWTVWKQQQYKNKKPNTSTSSGGDGRGTNSIYGAVHTKYDTGGYTGAWGPEGRIAMLHEKELVLNPDDTANFLSAINIVRDIASLIDLRAAAQQSALSMMSATSIAPTTQTLQQEVTIHAEFPNATQRTEIEAAFDTLLNRASQFANRKN